MKATLTALALCALVLDSALAIPSMHHHHQRMHKKDVDYNNPDLYKGVDWKKVFYPGDSASSAAPAVAPTTTAAAPASTPEADNSPPASSSSAAPAPTSSASSSSVSVGSDGFSWDGFGGSTTPVNNGNVDQYIGNWGIPAGSNIQKVDASVASSYKYTNQFKSIASETITIIVWNKVGQDGRPNSGQFSPPVLSFDIAPGASQYVAFAENSQVAFCHDSGKKTAYGANDCTFGEADFGNESNNKWSGYDVSSIQNTAGNSSPMTITCPNGETSSNTGNNYISDSQPGGIGGNLAPGPVQLTTSIG